MQTPPTHQYNFCSRCKGDLEVLKTDRELKCKNCGFHFYINPPICTGIILVNPKKGILLVIRNYDPGKGLIDIPGGFVDINESLEESLIRELKEELNFEPKNLKYVGSYPDEYFFQGINSSTLIAVYSAETDQEKFEGFDDVGEVKFYKFEETKDLPFAFSFIKKAISDYLEKFKYNKPSDESN